MKQMRLNYRQAPGVCLGNVCVNLAGVSTQGQASDAKPGVISTAPHVRVGKKWHGAHAAADTTRLEANDARVGVFRRLTSPVR